jgi:hypothetical protein
MGNIKHHDQGLLKPTSRKDAMARASLNPLRADFPPPYFSPADQF